MIGNVESEWLIPYFMRLSYAQVHRVEPGPYCGTVQGAAPPIELKANAIRSR